MQLLDSRLKAKKRKGWVTGTLGGALLAALVLPLALTNASAALDSGSFLIQAENTNDPEITSRSGMSIPDLEGGEIPEESAPVVNTSNIMRTTWDTNLTDPDNFPDCTTITLPVKGARADYEFGPVTGKVNWGDGTSEPLTVNASHTYAPGLGKVNVTIEGTFDIWGNLYHGYFFHENDPDITLPCLISVDEWGSGTKTTNLSDAFIGATALERIAEIPSGVTNMSGTFAGSTFNNDISNWDTSAVTNMGDMFSVATKFNQPIGGWDMSNVQQASAMFYYATAFNQPIGNWKTSNMVNMYGMFESATSFSQDLTSWDVGLVTGKGDFNANSGLTADQLPKFPEE